MGSTQKAFTLFIHLASIVFHLYLPHVRITFGPGRFYECLIPITLPSLSLFSSALILADTLPDAPPQGCDRSITECEPIVRAFITLPARRLCCLSLLVVMVTQCITCHSDIVSCFCHSTNMLRYRYDKGKPDRCQNGSGLVRLP
jgi:hypothetical protein